MLEDFADILKPGTCAACESQTLTYTDPETGRAWCVECLELVTEPLHTLTELTRGIIADLRQTKGETCYARN